MFDALNHVLHQCIMCAVCVSVLNMVEAYGAEVKFDSRVVNRGGKV